MSAGAIADIAEASELRPYLSGISCRAQFACPPHIEIDLLRQRLHAVELSFRSEIPHESHFDIFAINVAIKVEQINFQHALRFSASNGWSITKIDDAVI